MTSPLIQNDTRSFQLNRADIQTLWKMLDLTCTALSPFAEMDPDVTSATPASELAALASDSTLRRTGEILARPDLKVECIVGGGSSALNGITLCCAGEGGSRAIVALTQGFDNAILAHYFSNASLAGSWLASVLNRLPDYIAWDEALSSDVAARPEIAQNLPTSMTLETMVYLLHALDMYRVAVYQNLLAHTAVGSDLSVTATEFDDAMRRSLSSGDIRWLLPAFLELTPNLRSYELNPQHADLEALSNHDVLLGLRSGEDGSARYLFGTKGTPLGIEFYRSWHRAVGMSIQSQAGVSAKSHFLIATAIANHMFTLQPDGKSHGQVRYEALDDIRLGECLQEILLTPLGEMPAQGPGRPADPQTTAGRSAPWSCIHCAQVLGPEDRFCPGCGKPASRPSPLSNACPKCGGSVPSGARFCSECGTSL